MKYLILTFIAAVIIAMIVARACWAYYDCDNWGDEESTDNPDR